MSSLTHGQWIGSVIDNRGIEVRVTLNIEKRSPGTAQILSHSPQFLHIRTCATGKYREDGDTLIFEPHETHFFDVNTGNLIPIEQYYETNQIKEPIPKFTTFKFQSRGRILAGSFQADSGGSGKFELTNTTADPTEKADHTLDWKAFKNFVATNYLNNPLVIFRGQPDNSHKLRTSFHRCDRNNLLAYLHADVPNLRHAVNAVSGFYYRENDAEHLGALLSLAQHHGYPTPLLDWTSSPYIAAFFAFTEPREARKAPAAVRIYVFNLQNWPVEPSPKIIYDPLPSITFHRFSAHNNPRFIPQQSMASFSNVDDMEYQVRQCETGRGGKHLTVIDIPFSERQGVIDELRLMGITAGSLFPGLDGVCRSIKEQHFNC